MAMHAPISIYRRGDLAVDVLAGESHSAAWAAVTGAAPLPPGSRTCSGAKRSRRAATAAARCDAGRGHRHSSRRPHPIGVGLRTQRTTSPVR